MRRFIKPLWGLPVTMSPCHWRCNLYKKTGSNRWVRGSGALLQKALTPHVSSRLETQLQLGLMGWKKKIRRKGLCSWRAWSKLWLKAAVSFSWIISLSSHPITLFPPKTFQTWAGLQPFEAEAKPCAAEVNVQIKQVGYFWAMSNIKMHMSWQAAGTAAQTSHWGWGGWQGHPMHPQTP